MVQAPYIQAQSIEYSIKCEMAKESIVDEIKIYDDDSGVVWLKEYSI